MSRLDRHLLRSGRTMGHPMARGQRLPEVGVAAQRRWPELGMLRLDDAPLFAAGARDTVRVTAWRGCYLRSSS